MRRPKWVSLSAAAVAAVLVSATTLAVEPVVLTPDLVTIEPKDFSIDTSTVSGRRLLRFDNEVLNTARDGRGALAANIGPLEVFPSKTKCGTRGEDRIAMQRLYHDANGNGVFERGTDTSSTTAEAGCMTFHAQHRHWHIDNFASYELYATDVDGERTGLSLTSSPKATFCLIDVHNPQAGVTGSPSSKYYRSCGRNATEGLSIGWSDEYPSTISGQWVDITGLAAGLYCFVSTADPTVHLTERNDANNAASVRVQIGLTASGLAETDC
ncbi:MAG: lysyl oxidase family protein [Chloroflexota bacterium]